MIRFTTTFGLFCAVAAAANGQNVRPSTNLSNDGALAAFDGVPATSGDHSVVIHVNSSNQVVCYTSDGRGIDWAGPFQVDDNVAVDRKDLDDPTYVAFGSGTNVYCLWEDRRSGDEHLYLGVSTDGGATWGSEQLIFATDITGDNARMSVSAGTGGAPDSVYVACSASPGDDTLHLLSSQDGGATFNDLVVAGVASDIDNFDMRADGTTVHIAYDDNISGTDDVYYVRSDDGGLTLTVGPTNIDPSGVGLGNSGPGINFALDGSTVAVTMVDEGVEDVLYVNVSLDGGTTFAGAVQVGDYTVDVDDVDNPEIMATGDNLVVVYEDNRTLTDEIYVATSTDNGATWTETAALGAGGFPRVSNLGSSGQDGCAVAFSGGVFPESCNGAISTDNGATFTAVTFSDTVGDADFAEITYNDFYGNFICTWLSDDDTTNDVFVGGVRPQTLTPIGWVPGPTNASFDLSGFEPSTAQGWVIGSLSSGNLPLPDGRNSGLGFDIWTRVTINLAVSGAFSTDLVNGAGSTPPVSLNFTGFTFFYIGVGINGVEVGEVTDVVEVNL